jgi:hypothetical protein
MINGCFHGQCSPTETIEQCVTIYRKFIGTDLKAVGFGCLPWDPRIGRCAIFENGTSACAKKASRPLANVNAQITSKCGATVQVSRKGLDLAMVKLREIAQQKIGEMTIQDIKDKVWGIKIAAEHLHVTNFVAPTFGYTFTSPQIITLTVQGGLLQIEGKWNARWKFAHASSKIMARNRSGFSAAIGIQLITTSAGHLQIGIASCDINIDMKIDFSGGIPGKIIDWFSRSIEKAANKAIKERFCEMMQNVAIEKINPKLETIPWNVPIDKNYLLDYTLVQPGVEMLTNVVQAHFKGVIQWGSEQTPIQQVSYPLVDVSDKMAYVYLSTMLPNTYLYSAYAHGKLAYAFTQERIPEKFRPYLRTTCSGVGSDVCIGLNVFKELGQKYPNCQVEFNLTAINPAPFLTVKVPTLSLAAKGILQMTVSCPGQSFSTVAEGILDISADIIPVFDTIVGQPEVKGNLTITNLSLNITKSTIGEISTTAIKLLIRLGSATLQVVLNKATSRGIEIPVPKNVNMKNLQFNKIENALMVGFDAEF